jgi:hypothetical protein
VRVTLHIEGGGDSKAEHINCRRGFRELLKSAGFEGRMPATKACGGRNAAYNSFKAALRNTKRGEYPVLLVDSEAPVSQSSAWQHLKTRDGWKRPVGAEEDQAQLMVQCMESWCVADREALREFFGDALHENPLPNPDHHLEAKTKESVQKALVSATHACGPDKGYEKGQRSFELLGRLDPAKLKKRLPHFARLCKMLDAKL